MGQTGLFDVLVQGIREVSNCRLEIGLDLIVWSSRHTLAKLVDSCNFKVVSEMFDHLIKDSASTTQSMNHQELGQPWLFWLEFNLMYEILCRSILVFYRPQMLPYRNVSNLEISLRVQTL